MDHFNSDDSKILCIDGARQIGKGFIIRKVAKRNFNNYIEINLANDYSNQKFFNNINSADSLYVYLEIIAGDKLGTYDDTIIFLDEIQIYPNLFTILKKLSIYKKYHFICSGTMLGIALRDTTLIPIGYITTKRMYPIDFEEFLLANNVGKEVINYMKDCYLKETSLDETIHAKIMELFKIYLYVGGLPESVNIYLKDNNIFKIREVQNVISRLYAEDAAKYDFDKRLKIKLLYNIMSSNMKNSVKRISYTDIENDKNARFSKYCDEFDYLLSSGVSLGSFAIANPKFPLVQSLTKNLIKLYYDDVGILSNILYSTNIQPIIYSDSAVNLGSVYETFVAQELTAHNHKLYYFDRRKMGEVDFIVDDYDNLTIKPLVIKSGKDFLNYQALPKMMRCEDYNIKTGYVFTNNREVKRDNNIVIMPIYYIMFI